MYVGTYARINTLISASLHGVVCQGIHSVSVLANNQHSSNTLTFTYDGPIITSLSPQTGPTAPGSTVLTVTGRNFGSVGSGVLFIASSQCLGFVGALYNDSLMHCLTPAGQGLLQAVYLTITATAQSSAVTSVTYFNYSAPHVTSVVPASFDTTANTLLTIAGSNFGLSGTTHTHTLLHMHPHTHTRTCTHTRTRTHTCRHTHTHTHMHIHAHAHTHTHTRTHTTHTHTRHTHTHTHAHTRTRTHAHTCTHMHTHSTHTHSTHSLSLSHTHTRRAHTRTTHVLTCHIPPSPGSASIGGVVCSLSASGSSYTDGQIICLLSPGHGANLSVIVSVASQQNEEGAVLFSYNPPVIFTVAPSNGPALGL